VPRTSPVARSTRRARRSLHPRYAALTALLVTLALVGLVSLQAMLAQSSFHTAELQGHIAELSDRYGVLRSEEAKLSAPGRVEAWALAHGMRPADVGHLVILTVPSHDARGGSADATLSRDSALVKPIVGSAG
jgi:cell division protein FtsL